MFRLTRPDARDVAAFLAAQRDAPWSYAEVDATRGAAPAGYTVDRTRVRLGTGAAVFARALEALRAWRMLSLGWAQVQPADAPQEPGTTVAIVVHHYGFWSMHACRVVRAFDDTVLEGGLPVRRVGFAYGTLPAHAARGEERFTIEWRYADDVVVFEVLAYSQPAHPLAYLGRPLARRQQRRFGRDARRAMVAAVADA